MLISLPIKFSQMDTRWGSHILGNNTNPTYDIYNYGCLLSCLAMVLSYYGVAIDPDQLNEELKQNGGFAQGSGEYEWGAINRLYPKLSETMTRTPSRLTDAQFGEIKTALDNNYPVILQIDYNPRVVAPTMHFVIAVAYNPLDENDITIVDPLGGTTHSLKDYLGWFHPSARDTIEAYVTITGQMPHLADGSAVPVPAMIYPNIVHGSAQWDATVVKYLDGRDPKQTSAEDLANVIGGIQSTATTKDRQVIKLQSDLATSQASVTSLTEQLAHLKDEQQAEQQTHAAQLDALKPNTDATKQLIAVYEGRIGQYKERVATLFADKQTLAVANAKLSAKPTQALLTTLISGLPALISWAKRMGKK